MEGLKGIRKKKGLTLREVAEHLSVSVNTVWRWENGSMEPTLDNLRRIFLPIRDFYRRFTQKPYVVPAAGVSGQLRGLVGSLKQAGCLSDDPGEVLGIASDLEDGRADEDGTIAFLSEMRTLVNQGAKFLESVGG